MGNYRGIIKRDLHLIITGTQATSFKLQKKCQWTVTQANTSQTKHFHELNVMMNLMKTGVPTKENAGKNFLGENTTNWKKRKFLFLIHVNISLITCNSLVYYRFALQIKTQKLNQ
ncbi:hypothetical protein CHS0354_023163 [Potamilus streckersoni]|uniref:Uncharacterized protein n=1 Tax=Potamilus streckersoni TaxID=2493646 RepID=A0AAE0VH90_9BIVA|nr:hypothetical protein CHS0354_023163 [Potamilus streckersoni]